METTELARRILVVDDLPDMRTTISGLFIDEGYYVQTASGKQEALNLLASDSFHIAILDIRLDDGDDSNQEGIELLLEIQEKDPAVVSIILSGYIDWEIYKFAQNQNIPIVRKSNFLQIIEEVDQVFNSRVRINWKLIIKDEEEFIEEIPRKMRIKLPAKQIKSESEEILRRLFSDPNLQKISISPIRRGYSGTIILKIIPWYQGLGRGEVIVAKIGESKLVRGEIDRYDSIRGIVGGHRIPKKLETAATRTLTGVIYTFAGLGDAQDFVTFFENSSTDQIIDVITNLFEKTCFPSRYEAVSEEVLDLSAVYFNLLRLNPQKLSRSLRNTMGGRHPFVPDETDETIILNNGYKLTNPVTFIQKNNLSAPSSTAMIHGDLHGYNILVDHRAETWLIDFTHTGLGPLWHDFTLFESFLKIALIETEDWQLLFEWESLLAKYNDLTTVKLPDTLAAIPNMEKLYAAVQTVREIAIAHGMLKTVNAYQISLLFNAIRLITIMNLPAHQRDHALIAAALIAEKLKETLESH